MEYYAPSPENRGVCFPAMKAPCGALFKKGTFSKSFLRHGRMEGLYAQSS